MKNLSAFWQKLIIWLCALIPCVIIGSGVLPLFINLIALLICGGFIYLKTQDENVKKSALLALVSTAIYSAVIFLLLILYNVGVMAGSYSLIDGLAKAFMAFEIIKAIYFVVCFILDIVGVLPAAKYFGLGCCAKNTDKPATEKVEEKVAEEKTEENKAE